MSAVYIALGIAERLATPDQRVWTYAQAMAMVALIRPMLAWPYTMRFSAGGYAAHPIMTIHPEPHR